jgi:hypothetical protein
MYRPVALVIDRSLAEAADAAIAASQRGHDRRPLERALARSGHARSERHERERAKLDEDVRRALIDAAPERASVLEALEGDVRKAAVRKAARLAGLLAKLTELRAPDVVRSSTRALLHEAIDRLDPTAPWVPDPLPPLAVIEDDDGARRINLHHYLELMLRAALDETKPIGTATEIATSGSRVDSLPPPVPGIESTAYGMQPNDMAWHLEHFILPRGFGPADRVVVVGLGGGPATWAVAGDVPSEMLDERLRDAVHALGPAEALVCFVWCENDVEEAWPVE